VKKMIVFRDPNQWVSNGSFSESQGIGASYDRVFSGNGSGNRIAMVEPYKIPSKTFSVGIAEGYNVAMVGFDRNKMYVGRAKGYVIPWTGSGVTVVDVEADDSVEYVVFVLRILTPGDVGNASLSISYEVESTFGGVES